MYNAYSDGGCNSNPGTVGVWSLVIYSPNDTLVTMRAGLLSDGKIIFTSPQLELIAVLECAKAFAKLGIRGIIWSDCEYISKLFASQNTPKKNLDIWSEVFELKEHIIDIRWVKGHGDSMGNNIADRLVKVLLSSVKP